MNKEQDAKYRNFMDNLTRSACHAKDIWIGCCAANGINTEEPVKDETTAAPEWVIEMMRTGKAVRCKVWDTNESNKAEHLIIGYLTNYPLPYFCDQGTAWKHAEPIPAWRPQDGEAVLFRHRENVGCEWESSLGTFSKGKIYFGNHKVTAMLLVFKEFDGDFSKIGKPWSEI